MPTQARQVMRAAALADPDEHWRQRLQLCTRLAEAEQLCAEALALSEATDTADRQGRRDKWHAWTNESANLSGVYRFIRDGPRPLPSYPVDPEGHCVGRTGFLQQADNFWWGLWDKPDVPAIEAWLEPLRRLRPFEPPPPTKPRAMTGGGPWS